MEQKDLAQLVEELDREAQAFPSFDDYMAAKEKSEGDSEWEKSVADAEEKSSPNSSEKVDETVESSSPSSVAPVTEPVEPKEKTWFKQEPYKSLPERTESLAHPVAPNVTDFEEPYKPVETVTDFVPVLEIIEVPWPGGEKTIHLQETQEVRAPGSLNSIHLKYRTYALDTANIDEVIARFKELEQKVREGREALSAIRSGLAERCAKGNISERGKIRELDSTKERNLKQASRMKADRENTVSAPPKQGIGIKLADGLNAMGMDREEILEQLKLKGKLDEATVTYVNKMIIEAGS